MGIIRVVKENRNRYLITHVEPLENEKLSWEARGMLAYLMTKPDDWEVHTNHLIKAGPAGKHKVQKIINELKHAGYMRRYQANDPITGKLETITEVYEKVSLNPICGGTALTVTRLSGDGDENDAVRHRDPIIRPPEKPATGKPGDLLNTEGSNIYIGDQLKKNYEHDSESIPGAYTEPPFEEINAMVSFLSGICKGFVNVFQPDDCDFYKAAILLIEKEYTEEDIRAFGPWWEKNGYYQGKPAVKSLLDEIENAIEGITPIDTQIHNAEASKSWKECNRWIGREIKACDFQDPITLQIVQQIGEGTLRQLNKDNGRQIRTLFFDLYGDLAKQNGA